MIFDCQQGSIYRIPNSNLIKAMVELEIGSNLGHNSIETRCLKCGKIDTYSKSDITNYRVYMCKTCGKETIYANRYARLKLEKVIDKDKSPKAVCKCLDCNSVNEYDLENLLLGKVSKCKSCIAGLVAQHEYGKVTYQGIKRNDDNKILAFIKCKECNKVSTPFIDIAVQEYKNNKLDTLRTCGCVAGANKTKSATKILSRAAADNRQNTQNINRYTPAKNNKYAIPLETDNFKNIKDIGKEVIATCKNCGITDTYRHNHIIDGEPCRFCDGLMVGDLVAHKQISDEEIARAKLSKDGEEHVRKMGSKFKLTVSNIGQMANEFEITPKHKFIPRVTCKCNNCGDEDEYKVKDINNGTCKCKTCDFNIIVGSTFGSEVRHRKKEVIAFKHINNKIIIDMQCLTCGTKISTEKIEFNYAKDEICPICSYKDAHKESESIIGNIFGSSDVKEVNGYTLVGKQLVLNKMFSQGKVRVKCQCIECGYTNEILCNNYDTDFIARFKNGRCNRCESLTSGTRNYINNNNWIGYVKNCRVVEDTFTEDGILKAKIKCMLCGDILVTPLIVFVYSDNCVCSKCRDKKIDIKCPSCKKMHDNNITLADLYRDESSETIAKKLICPVTKSKVAISHFRHYQESQSRLDFITRNYSDLGDIEEVPGYSGLIKSTEKYYVGTDGEKYYTCYCTRHNKFMTLKDDEMAGYDHLYCADSRMFGYMT